MRISIWQQWASNHSTDFVLVGTFSTHEAAVKAADELHSVLQQIQDYWVQIRSDDPDARFEGILTPPEKAIRCHYEIDWIPVDWFKFSGCQRIDDYVSVVERFVLFSGYVEWFP